MQQLPHVPLCKIDYGCSTVYGFCIRDINRMEIAYDIDNGILHQTNRNRCQENCTQKEQEIYIFDLVLSSEF